MLQTPAEPLTDRLPLVLFVQLLCFTESRNLDSMVRLQSTIKKTARVSGKGYWSGTEVDVEFRPALENQGVTFVRGDLPNQPRIQAAVSNRVKGPRRTTLVEQGHAVEMVEHILAALQGLQIDNCEIWVNQPEMPGCDGSSAQFVEALTNAERVEQSAIKPYLIIDSVIRVGDDDCWIQCEPSGTSGLDLTYQLEYGHSSIGEQTYSLLINRLNFLHELASARTFVLESEAKLLRKQGLGQHVGYDEILVFGESGPIQNELRFSNECARHKMLDVVGDLALTGTDIHGKLTAHKSGHRLNAMMAMALLEQVETKTDFQRDSENRIFNKSA